MSLTLWTHQHPRVQLSCCPQDDVFCRFIDAFGQQDKAKLDFAKTLKRAEEEEGVVLGWPDSNYIRKLLEVHYRTFLKMKSTWSEKNKQTNTMSSFCLCENKSQNKGHLTVLDIRMNYFPWTAPISFLLIWGCSSKQLHNTSPVWLYKPLLSSKGWKELGKNTRIHAYS